MTTYYVDPQTGGGSPAGSGTESDPWNGLGNISWGSVSAGDVVDLQGGTHTAERLHVNTTGGSAGNVITIQNGTIDSTTLNIGTAVLLNATTHYIRLESLTIKAWGGGTTDGVCYGIRAGSGGGRGLQVVNCELDGTNAGGTVTNRAIQVNIDGSTDFEDLLFQDNRIHDCDFGLNCNRATEGETARPVGARIIGNSFWNMPGRCIWFYMDDADADGSDIAAGRTAPNLHIVGNTIVLDTSTGSPTAPISFRGSVNGYIARNYIKNAGTDGTSATVNAINPGADTDIIIEDNTIVGVFGTGAGDNVGIIIDYFKVDTNETIGAIVRRNWIEDCNADTETGALSLFKSVNGQFYSNVLFNGSIGIKLNSDINDDNLFYNNAIAGMNTQASSIKTNAQATTYQNNALHTTGNTCIEVEGATSPNPTEDYNCFHGYSGDPILDGATPVTIGSNSIDGDMKYKDQTNGDLRLDGDSPCIAAGTKWWSGTPIQGQDGLRFYNKPSMGAYEYRPGKSGHARTAGAMISNTLGAGVDIAKAKAA